MRPIHSVALCAALIFLVVFTTKPAHAAELAPSPIPSASFDTGMLHVDRYGSGVRTIIFIPGLSCGTWEWNEQIARFSPKYTVYAITLPGFDGRPATSETPLFASFSNDFWKLLETTHIKKPVVIGHSLGGTLAIYLAEAHPERLSGIIALDGLPVFPTMAQADAATRKAAAAKAAASYAALSASQAAAYETKYMSTIGTTDATLAPQLGTLAAKSDPKAVAAWLQEDLSDDLRPSLAKITIPFLEIMPYNAADHTQPPMNYTQDQSVAFYAALLSGAPNVHVAPVAPARHFAMLDQPAAVDAAVETFLASLV